jgi:hypothetical protein
MDNVSSGARRSRNALAKAAASGYRSAGTLAIARRNTSCNHGGTSSRGTNGNGRRRAFSRYSNGSGDT